MAEQQDVKCCQIRGFFLFPGIFSLLKEKVEDPEILNEIRGFLGKTTKNCLFEINKINLSINCVSTHNSCYCMQLVVVGRLDSGQSVVWTHDLR